MMFNSMDAYGFLSIHPSLWFPLKTQQIPAIPPVGTTKKCPDESQTSEHLPATQVMKKLSHPNIIRCYGYFWDYPSQSLYIALWPVLEERIFRWKSPVAAENPSTGKPWKKTGKTHSKWNSICGCSYPRICWNRSWSRIFWWLGLRSLQSVLSVVLKLSHHDKVSHKQTIPITMFFSNVGCPIVKPPLNKIFFKKKLGGVSIPIVIFWNLIAGIMICIW